MCIFYSFYTQCLILYQYHLLHYRASAIHPTPKGVGFPHVFVNYGGVIIFMHKVLVLGGSGLVGKAIIAEYLKKVMVDYIFVLLQMFLIMI